MLGYSLFYGLGVGSAVFAMALLAPVMHGGSPIADTGGDVMHALIGGNGGSCPYLESQSATPHSAVRGSGSQSICPYLADRGSRCPYLRERAGRQEGAGSTPSDPGLGNRGADGWFDSTPRPRTVALLQVEHPRGADQGSAGWF